MPFLTQLFVYPVKGCRGIALKECPIDPLGLVGDRRFLVVDKAGKFLTQRTFPRLGLIETALSSTTLSLTAAKQGTFSVPLSDPNPSLATVQVWSSTGLQAEDAGALAASWLSDFLSHHVRLVRIGPAFCRPVKPEKARPGDLVTFADAYPFLILSEASLEDLNHRLAEPVPLNRFRPNLVVSGCPPYMEDTWPRFHIGSVAFRSAGPCARCIVTTTDQSTAQRGQEPLKTLAQYRRSPDAPTDVIFGQNAIHETKTGVLKVGDNVRSGG